MGRIGIVLLVAGVLLLAAALTLCLLPGPIADCGSILAPTFPLKVAARCPSSQDAHLAQAVVAAIVGLLTLSAGVVLRPQRQRQRRRRSA